MGKPAPASPFAPATLARLPPIEGVRFATAEAGIRYKGRTDLLVAVMDEGTSAAGVLTQSKTCSAPVLWCRDSLKSGKARILVVNSGNANAFTGMKGRAAVDMTVEHACQGRRMRPKRSLRRFHRRHRRADGCHPVRPSAGRPRRFGRAGRL